MTNTTQYFQVADFDRQQHYSDRRLVWIKLHNALLDDPAFCALSPLLRYILTGLMLLASRCNNRIPNDPKYLTHALHLDEQPDLTPLFDAGFLLATRKRSASKTIATRYQNASSEKELEREKKKNPPVVPPSKLPDSEWLESLKSSPAYRHLDINVQFEKARVWVSVNPNRQLTRKFFVNWLNRADKPMNGTIVPLKPPQKKCEGLAGGQPCSSYAAPGKNHCQEHLDRYAEIYERKNKSVNGMAPSNGAGDSSQISAAIALADKIGKEF